MGIWGGPPGAWFGDPGPNLGFRHPGLGMPETSLFPVWTVPGTLGLGPPPNLPKPSKSSLFAVSLSPPVKRKKRFRPYIISLYGPSRVSAGGPPQKVTFSQKSDFLRVPPKPRFGTGLGPVWDRSGTGLGTPPHPPPQGGGEGGKSEVSDPSKTSPKLWSKTDLQKRAGFGPLPNLPPHPPKRRGVGGSVWGALLGTFGTSKKCPKTSPFFMVGF